MTAQSPDTPRGLEELAGRVERATGPDRELDVMIAQAIGFSVNGLTVDKLLSYSPHNTIAEIAIWASGDPTPFFVPRYTGSLDDAMMLVHDAMEIGWHRHQRDKDNGRRWTAHLTFWPEPPIPLPLTTIWRGQGNSGALALTAAALRSHIQGNG